MGGGGGGLTLEESMMHVNDSDSVLVNNGNIICVCVIDAHTATHVSLPVHVILSQQYIIEGLYNIVVVIV